jgi:DNA-binding SARP family transcriptional activator
MTSLSISLLGSFQVTLQDKPVTGFETAKERALLAYLAIEAGQPQRRAMLAEMLWPGRPEGAARANLRHTLAHLRRVIGDDEAEPPYLLTTRETVQFNRASDTWVDVDAFTELVFEGNRGDRPNTGFLEEAVELYRGELLEGFSLRDSAEFEEWATHKREKYRSQVLDVLSHLTDIGEKSGEYEKALRHARRQMELEPWDERANRQLMRLLAETGQRGRPWPNSRPAARS